MFLILKLLKLLDNVCKYEMHPMSIVEDTEWTWFCQPMDWRTDGQRDKLTRWNQYPPLLNFVKEEGMIIFKLFCH